MSGPTAGAGREAARCLFGDRQPRQALRDFGVVVLFMYDGHEQRLLEGYMDCRMSWEPGTMEWESLGVNYQDHR
ncbi:hypothetical protein [Streptomyces jeddahensis]|uniref:hypothetical protein n=1 Tax=Streptomyces jeddahensis TaxID=1716141 RepID=UPI0012FFBD10|nr:hypothetical protein [Streptomyces jeddahensis]